MQAVDEYQQSSGQKWFLFSRSEEQLALERKSCAQRLARSATQVINDRRMRAAAKVSVYNHLIPILDQHYGTQQALHRTYRRACAAIFAVSLLAVGLAYLL